MQHRLPRPDGGEAVEDALRFLRGEPLRQEVPEEEYDYQKE